MPTPSGRFARLVTQASSAGGEPEAGLLTVDEACKLLGVNSNATFDEILQAKEKLLRFNDGNTEKMMQVYYGEMLGVSVEVTGCVYKMYMSTSSHRPVRLKLPMTCCSWTA